MKNDERIYFLTGDLGFHVLEKIEKDFSKRFINVGIAEQNMIGIAAGLALSGKKVYVYSIIPFVTMRCFEQIRDDLCYHDLDVTIIGVGSGLSYGILSGTHFALEDIAILRSLPNMTIFSPADEIEASQGIRAFNNYAHPIYMRIGKSIEPQIYKDSYEFRIGKSVVLKKGKDIVIFTTGSISHEVLKSAHLLKIQNNIDVMVINIHTIKPLEIKRIKEFIKDKKIIVSVEEHGLIGGLGSIILEIFSDNYINRNILRIGTKDHFIKEIGTQAYLRKILHLDANGIYDQIINYLHNEK